MRSSTVTAFRGYSAFQLRRLLERLREGLYDPLAVRLLTVHHEALDTRIQSDLRDSAADTARHLCLCGAYGQGKSHTLAYIREYALHQGYAVSAMNLDPREVPLYQFRQVYRALLRAMILPSGHVETAGPVSFIDAWRTWAAAQGLDTTDPAMALAALLPASMPHVFKAILVALARPTQAIPAGLRILARYRDFRPADFPWTLRRALYGEAVPVARLRAALKYRQVSFYRQASLALSSHEPFLHMTLALPQLFRTMGYRGWVLLFDEGEAITQVSRPLRARSYRLLHHLLCPQVPTPGLYPVFAFTPDFFQRLQEEDYDLPYFERNYAQAWGQLSVYHLRGLSRAAWQDLCNTLIGLHAAAYGWHADQEHLVPLLTARLATLPLHDPRLTLKALVDELDQVQQQTFFAQGAGVGY
jgi:P-loop Domain of unknown function (DUF2791)